MKRFTTIAQHRILQRYWITRTPFTVLDLLAEGLAHFPFLCSLSLRWMERRGQIKKVGLENGEPRYIGTTGSKAEWDSIWTPKLFSAWADRSLSSRGLNRYERQDRIAALTRIMQEYAQREGIMENAEEVILCDHR